MKEIVFDLIGVLAGPSWRELVVDPRAHDWRGLKTGRITEAAFWGAGEAAAYRRALGVRRDRVALLERLRGEGWSIAVASNFAREWVPTIRERVPAGLIGRWVISAEVGAAKPDLAFWTALGAAPGTVMVDDQAANVAAATAAGLRGLVAAPGVDLAEAVLRALAP